MKNILRILLLAILLVTSCKSPSEPVVEKPTVFELSKSKIEFGIEVGSETIDVKVANDDWEMAVDQQGSWLTATVYKKKEKSQIVIRTTKNAGSEYRYGKITLVPKLGEPVEITIEQAGLFLSGDIKIPVKSGTASSFQNKEEIEKSFDGNYSTIYHSAWNNTPENYFPITLQYELADNADRLDYLVYYPRTSGTNGHIKELEIFVNTRSDQNFVSIYKGDFDGSSAASRVDMPTAIANPKSVKFVVKSGVGDRQGFVSCSEMEFYKLNAEGFDTSTIFADAICSKLKPGVTQQQINNITLGFYRDLANRINSGSYETKWRVYEATPYRDPENLASELKTAPYNRLDNATGMLAERDKEIVIIVGETNGERIGARIVNWTSGYEMSATFPLTKGVNKILPDRNGHIYINYYTKNYKTAAPITMNITGGVVNGYFDINKHTEAEGQQILSNAKSTFFDVLGNHYQVATSVAGLRASSSSVRESAVVGDQVIRYEHEIMGLVKYNKVPKNRMFGFFNVNGGNPYATSYTTSYPGAASISDANVMKNASWVLSHEFGHVNQTRPGMKWVSTTEVTNNIFSAWIQYKFVPNDLRLEHEVLNSGDGSMSGGRFNAFLNYGIIGGEQWLCQKGPDKMTGYENGGDVFVSLVPLWQLQLYYTAAEMGSNKDFYADIYEIVRNTNESGLSNGQLQLNFIRNACDVTKEDLTDFFYAAGLLKPIDKMMNDYTNGQLTITQAQCNELKQYASKYPKPISPVIYYISGNSIKTFKDRLNVEGTFNTGVSGSGTTREISHSVWKNVTVFETYEGEKLIKISMVGTADKSNTKTLVQYPAGATRIEAVSWDGKRTLVYGTR